jgi:hypothetical protein
MVSNKIWTNVLGRRNHGVIDDGPAPSHTVIAALYALDEAIPA